MRYYKTLPSTDELVDGLCVEVSRVVRALAKITRLLVRKGGMPMFFCASRKRKTWMTIFGLLTPF